ncbi:TetR/AcrR family transcriptional regulator [Actinacidiphila sp. DG2A-62]|uniref:TetR/AcrR family transcriptional regulator n=1 Tax=Actinacidiphila sp. DG2A-62 TaxID=3108821 RepID=UPI002DBEDDAE|nr:TetR/AcrR family transcriptional regulator [Actinacidiphila sp. DG2A-62]MEC3992555.1 TetR/AcrR family transcriptional regulator [Actinacidiphila sp. DG2A-62]
MTQTAPGTGRRVSEARERLLRTAARLFYAEGIHTVGVDRLVAEAKVTNATFYRHFRSKDDLAVAYIGGVDQAVRGQIGSLMATDLPADGILRGIGASLAEQIASPGYRGCAFLNAAAEYPSPEAPVHRAVVHHREWFLQTITGLFAEVSDAPAEPAWHFVMLRDGAMSAGHLGDPAPAGETLTRGIDGLLRVHCGRGAHAPAAGSARAPAADADAPAKHPAADADAPEPPAAGIDCAPSGA